MDVKTTFFNVNLKEDVYMDQPMRSIEEGKERNTWCVNLRNQYMDLNKLTGNDTLSSVILLCHLVLKENIVD